MASKNACKPQRRLVARLFVAGDAPNSRIARENLRRWCEDLNDCEVRIEEVDVLQDAQTALAEGVFVTPALQVLEPGPGTLIFGNLSNEEVLRSLVA